MARLLRSLWATIVFLLGFTVLIALLSRHFLIPALLATQDATPAEKRLLSGSATLLLAVVLFILSVGILLIFRVRRFFVPPPPAKPPKTQYIDAWTEAGRRMRDKPPPSDEE